MACVIYWIGAREFTPRAGWIGLICWLTLPALWGVAGGRQAIEDVIFTLVGVLYVYAAYRVVSDEDPRWLTVAGVFAGLALLTKGLLRRFGSHDGVRRAHGYSGRLVAPVHVQRVR